jgi:hypothetical protein
MDQARCYVSSMDDSASWRLGIALSSSSIPAIIWASLWTNICRSRIKPSVGRMSQAAATATTSACGPQSTTMIAFSPPESSGGAPLTALGDPNQ